MKWFTRDWTQGRLSEAQSETVRVDYAAHVAALRLAAPDLAPLVDLDVHDAQVRGWDRTRESFRWRLLVGDLQRGYEHAVVTYSGAHVVGGDEELAALRLDAPDVELLYDELDMGRDGMFVHRVLLWPAGELWVSFATVAVTRTGAEPSDRRRAGRPPGGPLAKLRRSTG